MLKKNRQSAYRHHKVWNLALVHLHGKDHYQGRHDSPESWEKYHRLLAERAATPS